MRNIRIRIAVLLDSMMDIDAEQVSQYNKQKQCTSHPIDAHRYSTFDRSARPSFQRWGGAVCICVFSTSCSPWKILSESTAGRCSGTSKSCWTVSHKSRMSPLA